MGSLPPIEVIRGRRAAAELEALTAQQNHSLARLDITPGAARWVAAMVSQIDSNYFDYCETARANGSTPLDFKAWLEIAQKIYNTKGN